MSEIRNYFRFIHVITQKRPDFLGLPQWDVSHSAQLNVV